MTAQNRIKNVLTLAVLAMAILILTTTSAKTRNSSRRSRLQQLPGGMSHKVISRI